MKTIIVFSNESSELLAAWAWETMPSETVWWPEVTDEGMPLTPAEVLRLCPKLVGEAIVTVSEHIILWFLKEVRDQRIKPTDLLVRLIREESIYDLKVTEDGDFQDQVVGGFFTERAGLLF